MKRILLILIVIFFFTELSFSQIPEEFLKTWYLEYFYMPEQGEIWVVDLDVPQGPSFTPTGDLQVTGNSFCNDFSGEYIYENVYMYPDTFQPISIIRDYTDCGSNEAYETQFFVPFINEQVGELTLLQEDFLVLQYHNPTYYQVYRDEPVLSIDENELFEILIYPNPVQDLLTIENTYTTEITSIKLYDVLGRLVLVEKTNVSEIDVSHLKRGVLFVEIDTDQGVITKKVIKE